MTDNIAALRAQVATLTASVRRHAIKIEPFDRSLEEQTWIGCAECCCAWPEGEPEDHGAGCIAAPTGSRESQRPLRVRATWEET